MDWTNNFYALVKDTEANITRAKNKLSRISDKGLNSYRRSHTDFISPNKLRESSPRRLKSFENISHNPDQYLLDDNLNLSMTSTQERQIRKMKEQIDSQNRAMDKLHKLVRSLDQERDYYKHQISFLKEQVDLLTEKIDSNLSHTSNDWQMTKIKNEVMHEIDKMKGILQMYTRDVKQPSLPWSLPHSGIRNESSVYNLDQICDELNLMNKRIDRIENGHLTVYGKSPQGLEKKSTSTHSKNLHHFLSPKYPDTNATELPKIRLAISSMNNKLDNLEKKLEVPFLTSSFNRQSASQKTPETFGYLRKLSHDYRDDDAKSSLSDLSSILSSSDENVEDGYLNSKSLLKKGRGKFKSLPRVKLDLELSDLDLSDEENLSFEADY